MLRWRVGPGTWSPIAARASRAKKTGNWVLTRRPETDNLRVLYGTEPVIQERKSHHMQQTMTPPKTAVEAVERILKHEASAEIREVLDLEVGQVLHQGDVYLHRVPDDWARGNLLGTRQIAVGATIGARHIVVGDFEVYEGVELPDHVTFSRLPERLREAAKRAVLGPVVVLKSALKEGEGLTHPEHAHHRWQPCVVQVQYQLDGRTLQAVLD